MQMRLSEYLETAETKPLRICVNPSTFVSHLFSNPYRRKGNLQGGIKPVFARRPQPTPAQVSVRGRQNSKMMPVGVQVGEMISRISP
jgi:hypothetical protein